MANSSRAVYWRSDIQGLRAVAVVAVILYHLGLPVKSGFLGVDIFIVVSGFVITSLLMRDINESGKVHLGRFFRWRFMRLFPAHVVMLATSLLLFYFLGPFGAHKAALNSARASLLFSANGYFFARSKDYFALGDDLTLFLNTWSLALEEQFYAMFSVVLFLLIFFVAKQKLVTQKSRNRSILILVVLLFVASIVLAIFSSFVWQTSAVTFKTSTLDPNEWIKFLTSRGQEFTFYSPFTRAWQFLLGSALAIVPANQFGLLKPKFSKVLLVCLIATLFLPGANSLIFFSWSRIAVTFLTGLIIVNATPWLSGQWLTAIGDRSYSLYLWHYPLIIITKSLNLPWVGFFALLTTLIFSEVSFRFIESPFYQRSRNSLSNKRAGTRLAFVIVLLSLGSLIFRLDLFAVKFVDTNSRIQTESDKLHYFDEESGCWVDRGLKNCEGDLRGSVLLLGDSHAGSLRPGFYRAVTSLGLTPQLRQTGKCFFQYFDSSRAADNKSAECRETGLEVQTEIIQDRPRLVLLLTCGRLYDSCPEGLVSDNENDWVNAGVLALSPILKAGIPVVVVRDIPILSPDPRKSATVARSILGKRIERYSVDGYYRRFQNSRLDSLLAELKNVGGEVTEVNFLNGICNESACRALSKDGASLWYDSDHLSVDGSLEISNAIALELSRIMKVN